MTHGPVLLYDGACGLCDRTVQFVLRHDRHRSLRFAPLDGDFGRQARLAHPALQGVDSVVWLDNAHNELHVKSAAILRLARYLGGAWRLAAVLVVVPRPMRDAVYDLVARHRHRLAPAAACVVPPPADRDRFLD